MKVIIAGSRDITDVDIDAVVRASPFPIHEVVSGTARGVDRLGEKWAEDNGMSVRQFPANWKAKGRGAGHARNAEMVDYADALVAIWDGESPGTASMISLAEAKGLEVFIWRTDES